MKLLKIAKRAFLILVVIALALVITTSPIFAFTLVLETYDGAGTAPLIYNPQWVAQSFSVATTYTLARVGFKLPSKAGAGSDITVGVRAADGSGYPTGAYLWSTTYAIAEWLGADWYYKDLGGGAIQLTSGNSYVVQFSSVHATDGFTIQSAWDTNPYAGGLATKSIDQGASWTGLNGVIADLAIRLYSYDAPTVTTQAASDVSYTSVTLNGSITNTGGENATSRGFDYDVDSGAPYANTWTEAGSFGVAAFTRGLTSLTPKTTYYYRAKATNSGGTGVGAEQSFTTLNVVQTNAVDSFYTSTTGIRFNGQILYATGFTIDNVGFVYDTSSHGDPGNIAPSTTVYPNYHTTSGSFGVGSFVYDATGLTAGSTYYYRAYVHMSTGVWVYGDELTEETFSEVIWYQPVAIISGTTLPDRAGTAQNGIISWGTNPAGINTSVGPAVPINPPVHTPTPTEPVPTFYPGTPTPPSGTLYPTAFEPVFPGGEFINDMLDAGGIPRSFWWNFIAFLTAIAGGFGIYGMIHRRAGTSSSALLAQAVTSGTILGVWWAVGIIDWWIIPLFAVEALAIIVAKQQYSW